MSSTISFNVVAHDLASRVFDKVGRAALAMAAKVKAADGVTTRAGDNAEESSRGYHRFAASMDKAEVAAGKLQEKMGFLTGDNLPGETRLWFRVVVAGLLTMTPLLGAATVGVGALAGAAVALGPGMLALGAAMVGVYKRMKDGNPALREAARAFEKMKEAWNGFLDGTQGSVGKIFTEAFGAMADLLPRLIPMTNRFANVFTRFLRDVRRDMDSPAFDKALNWFKNIGSLVFKNTLAGLRNLAETLYHLGRAFQDAGIDIKMKWFKDWTQALEGFAKSLRGNKDFKAFIDYFKEQWPTISRILTNIGTIIVKMSKGLAPVGEDILKIIEDLTSALAKIPPDAWEQIGRGFIALSFGIKALGVALPTIKGIGLLMQFLGFLTGLGGGASLISKLGGLGRGLMTLAAGISRIAPMAALITGLAVAFDKLGFAISGTGGGFGGISGRMPPILQFVQKLAEGKFDPKAIKIAFEVAGMTGLRTARRLFDTFKNKVVSIAIKVAMGALEAAKKAYTFLRNKTVSLTLKAALTAWTAARNVYTFIKNKAVTITSVARLAAWNAAKTLYNFIKPKVVTITSAARLAAWNAAKTLYNFIKPKVVTITSASRLGAWTAAKTLYNYLKPKVVTITTNAVLGAWQAAKSLYDSLVSKTVSITVDVIGNALDLLPGRAAGGPVMAGKPYMVGEVGPEVFIPSQSGNIVPNHKLGSDKAQDDETMAMLLASQAALLEELGAIREALEGLPRRYQQIQRQGRR